LTTRSEETTMTTDEAARLHLYERARAALGDPAAETLMSAFHPDHEQLATKADLGLLRSDVTHLETSLRSEMANLEIRLRSEIAVLEANLRGEILAANSNLLRTLFFGMITSNATLVGLVFAAVRLA
jgi:hypothetical protein